MAALQSQLDQLGVVDHPDAGSLIDECNETLEEIRQQIRALGVD